MKKALVVMGVAGCGKSSLARAIANARQWRLIEGDDFHSTTNREKMSKGIALTDEDRSDWLNALGLEIQKYPEGAVLACSALKKSYRDRLRSYSADLHFAFLEIEKVEAQQRVEARAATHFFSASLVDTQFATLEIPLGEPNVIGLNATERLDVLVNQVMQWLERPQPNRSSAWV